MGFNGILMGSYPLLNIQIAIETCHRNSGFINPLKIVIFHSFLFTRGYMGHGIRELVRISVGQRNPICTGTESP